MEVKCFWCDMPKSSDKELVGSIDLFGNGGYICLDCLTSMLYDEYKELSLKVLSAYVDKLEANREIDRLGEINYQRKSVEKKERLLKNKYELPF